MSEEELVEQMRKQIYQVLRQSVEGRSELVKDNAIDGVHAWNVIARECLRQMEWAWEKGWKDHARLGESDTEAGGRFQSVAPEGWRK